MVNENVKVNIKEEPSYINNIAVGFSKEAFLLAFNCDKDGVPEKTFAIAPEELSEIVEILFKCGIEYQDDMGVDIGFGLVEEDEEDGENN